MPEPKAQLIDPQGPIDVPGVNITGVTTATGGFVGTVQGVASSISSGSNVVAGIITATSFVGDVTGTASSVTKGVNIDVGIITASSFTGDLTGNAAGLSTTTANLKLGIVTSTSFAGNLTGNSAGLSVTTSNANLGIVTATYFWGDGSNLTGIAATNWIKNNVTASGADTTIDLNNGNTVVFTHDASTTVSFANTGTSNLVTFIRKKDASETARTITWPSSINWNGGSAPTLDQSNATGDDAQQFMLLTRDEGVTWYGWENVSYNVATYSLWSWGYNYFGTLGQNNRTTYSSPIQIPGTWLSLGDPIYNAQSLAGIKAGGSLWMWGYNNNGVLGQNNTTRYSSPVQIPGTTWSNNLSHAMTFTGAVKTDGSLWTWGNNYYGQLGVNSAVRHSSPVQVPGTTWSTTKQTIGLGEESVTAIKTDGTLWAWGRNVYGNLGQNSVVYYSSPVQVPGSTWSAVSRGLTHVAALKTDSTLWVWGSGAKGSLGVNQPETSRYSSPIQIPGTWSGMFVGYNSMHGMKTDGTLWGWGSNTYGQLGVNDRTDYSSPVQIPGTTWSASVGGTGIYGHTKVGKTDGTLWTFGANMNGVLGLNNNTYYSSPVQIPGAWGTKYKNTVCATYKNAAALKST